MEAEKEFHFKDAFFIAERLDAIQNNTPVIPRTEKEFHSKDNYIIWTKLSYHALPPVIPPGLIPNQPILIDTPEKDLPINAAPALNDFARMSNAAGTFSQLTTWQAIKDLIVPAPPAFNDYHGQVYTLSNQSIAIGSAIVWAGINEANGVSFLGAAVSVTFAGIYRLDYTATLKNAVPAGGSDGFSIYKNGLPCAGSNFESEPITPVDFIRSIAGQCMVSINPGDVIEIRSTLRTSRIFASNLFSSRASMQVEKIQ